MIGLSHIRTEDGTVLARDPATGIIAAGRTFVEAAAELRRLLSEMEAA